ncbi:MAG: CDGSH iron-sulfur domain-containing protein, partial [Actinomycetes bacterium]
VYPDGPILVRGDADVVLADNTPLPRRRKVVAICRCGHSALQPWCDGTHKLVWKPGRDSALGRRVEAEEDA